MRGVPHGERPEVTISGAAMGPPVDVIGSGTEEQHPPRRWLRAALACALVAAVVGALLVDRRGDDAPAGGPDAPPADEDLRLVETGGRLTLAWGYGGRLDISLPVLIRNDGPDMTVASLALHGTSLAQPAVDVELTSGGRLPLTLRQSMNCPEGVTVPAHAALRLEVTQEGVADTRWLPLPDGAAESLASALAQQCRAVPLEQALVLQSEEEQALPDVVELRVVADNIGTTAIQLLSVVPTTGLDVTVAPTSGAVVETPSLVLPHPLGEQQVAFRLAVSVRACTALAQSDRLDQAGVADIGYDDGRGRRAVKPVVGDFPRLRELVERTC